MAKTIEIQYVPTDKQNELHGSNKREILLIGGRGSGKTYAGIIELYLQCIEHPGNRCLMLRQQLTNLLTSTLTTFKKIIPPEAYKINTQTHEITIFTDGAPSSIFYSGCDDEKAIRKFLGSEWGTVLIDQAEEISSDTLDNLIPCLRHKVKDLPVPYKLIYLANPIRSYILNKFTQNMTENMQMINISTFDNPHRNPGYIDMLTELYKGRDDEYAAMVLGDIRIKDEDNVLIKYDSIQKCTKQAVHLMIDKCVVGVDPARMGSDSTIIYGAKGTKIIKEIELNGKDEDSVASISLQLAKEIGANCICVDSIGPGSGVITILNKLCYMPDSLPTHTILPFNGSAKAKDPAKYYNLRAEGYDQLARLIGDNGISIPDEPKLISELASVHYSYNMGRMLIEDKGEIKKHLGRSPDHSDALMYTVYALNNAPTTIKNVTFGENKHYNTYMRPQQAGSYADAEGQTFMEDGIGAD